jgi:hypothetical protein
MIQTLTVKTTRMSLLVRSPEEANLKLREELSKSQLTLRITHLPLTRL